MSKWDEDAKELKLGSRIANWMMDEHPVWGFLIMFVGLSLLCAGASFIIDYFTTKDFMEDCLALGREYYELGGTGYCSH